MKRLPDDKYKWSLMLLGGLTNAAVVAVPFMSLAVLLPEISQDIQLNLLQAGLVWGIGSLPMIFASMIAGRLCDRFGPKIVLIITCVLAALTGALRGLSTSFPSLMVTVLLMGCFTPLISVSVFKVANIWFTSKELGLANGIATLGMALGFFIGSLISASLLSPALGGWRNVFFAYGGLALLFTIPWMLSRRTPAHLHASGQPAPHASFRESLGYLARIKDMWLLGLAVLGVSGGVQGVLGYLTIFLQGKGWSVASASGVVAAFHIASMAFVLPLSMWSDRHGSRRRLLIGTALLSALGVGLLSVVNGAAVWVMAITAGSVRDTFMAIFLTRVSETDGVEPKYFGVAIGFVMFFMGIGNLVAPPLGNSLAGGNLSGLPLAFWAALIILGAVCVFLTTGQKHAEEKQAVQTIQES